MKKNWFIGTLILGLCGVLASPILAQRGQAQVSLNGKQISIDYGRPALQGRDMLGQLPVGGFWRMGKDAATTLETAATLKAGDVVVPPGSYRLRAKRVSEERFHLVITGDSGEWEIPLEPFRPAESVELFTITLEPAGSNQVKFSMAWGTTGQSAVFTVE